MRVIVALAVALVVVVGSHSAVAAAFTACWVTQSVNADTGFQDTVTRCRIAGGDTVDYASDNDVPSVLYPNMGTDLTGQCWYYTSAATAYVIVALYSDGTAEMGWSTDPGNSSAIIAIGPTVPRCTSEPTPISDPSAEAWDYAMSYIHDPPLPNLNPAPGGGVTGLETFIGVPVPPDHAASLSSGANTLEVEIVVDAVVVTWGDGRVDTYPPNEEVLAGYPDGDATHVYEVKNASGVDLVVEYDWTARWRVDGGPWTALDVPNTETLVSYPVAEIVSRLTD